MPLVLITLVTAVVAGMLAPRRAALTITGACAAVTMVAFVWAALDGQGNDPWWLVAVAAACSTVALAITDRLARHRQRRLA